MSWTVTVASFLPRRRRPGDLAIEILGGNHDEAGFDLGVEAVDLAARAGQITVAEHVLDRFLGEVVNAQEAKHVVGGGDGTELKLQRGCLTDNRPLEELLACLPSAR